MAKAKKRVTKRRVAKRRGKKSVKRTRAGSQVAPRQFGYPTKDGVFTMYGTPKRK